MASIIEALTVHFKKETKDKLRALAEEGHRSLTRELTRLIDLEFKRVFGSDNNV